MTETTKVIKKSLPYVEDVGIESAINEIVRTLNSAHIKNSTNTSNVNNTTFGLDGVILSGSYSITGPSASQAIFVSTTQTLTHNLGKIPSAFIVIDCTSSSSGVFPNVMIGIKRVSWTDSQITIRIECIDLIGGSNVSGTYKILVLR